ncbi:Retrovirus-related Pol polyprotein from transposon TNT 1-94 [Vitis vinifera]|uniref:Retrovirus-related Pol polyprotein from transposon TNT 1-94 n=1 Tax=Vitis vinifera TaxID=29760 RepID=A0A438E027_VITVI|nr:Retrovirus-related Pol polyprotein from transposon TNT 1-94 [Vitis vinifera]
MATHLKLLQTTVYDGVVKLTYNALKEEWTLEELMSIVKKPQHKNSGGSKQFKRRGNSSQGALVDLLHLCLSLHHGPLCDSSSVNSVVGCKHARMNLSSSMLWHKRLDFETCVVCLKGKMIAKTRNEKIDRCEDTLDLIHTDICGPLTPTALGGYKYFITFIDDFSRYGYVELIHEKSDSLNVFKAFKAKVEFSWESPLKLVKSDRGGEYYGRYDETGQILDHSLSFYWNAALMRDIQCQALSTEWGCRKEESHIVGYGEVRPYNPQSKKLDPKTISGFFVGYCIGSRGSRFYCSSHTTRIIESDRVVYFEDEVNVDPNFVPREIPFGEEHVVIPFPTSHVPNVDVPIVQQPATNQESMVIKWNLAFLLIYLLMGIDVVWDLVELPHGCKPIGCKWVFKTKRDSCGRIEKYKARLVVKGYSQREEIDFKETFSPVSTKDIFRVIMAIVAHFDLELHQMDVKTAFLNGDLDEDVYMEQPTGFYRSWKGTLSLQA